MLVRIDTWRGAASKAPAEEHHVNGPTQHKPRRPDMKEELILESLENEPMTNAEYDVLLRAIFQGTCVVDELTMIRVKDWMTLTRVEMRLLKGVLAGEINIVVPEDPLQEFSFRPTRDRRAKKGGRRER